MTRTSPGCPRCDRPGQAVAATTTDALVRADARASLEQPAYFCSTPECEVVYFDARDGSIRTEGVAVAIFQKETHPQRPVCYCFEHTAAAVLAASRTDGSNGIVEAIVEACRQGLDRCEQTNPQGRCCLGNVRALLRAEVSRGEPCSSCRTGGAT
jgi:hypothetical protein